MVMFTFASPVVVNSEYPIYLDALLAFAAVQAAEEKRAENPWSAGDDLPLDRAGTGKDWVYRASRLVFTPSSAREIVNMQRKSSPEMFYSDFDIGLWGYDNEKKLPPTINTKSGQFRAYQYYVSTQWMDKAVAWCIGDRELITQLLSRITYVGKLGRNGWGLINSITVMPEPDASVKWALRVLPPDVDSPIKNIRYVPVVAPPRAPYWNKLNNHAMMEPII